MRKGEAYPWKPSRESRLPSITRIDRCYGHYDSRRKRVAPKRIHDLPTDAPGWSYNRTTCRKRCALNGCGDENNIPDGWVLCNGRSDIPGLRVPDLTGRFIVGAGPSGNPVYKAGQFAEADRHAHDIVIPQYTFTTTQNGGHNHAPPGDWYDRDLLGDVSALGREYHNAIDRGSPSVKNVRTSTNGDHTHSVTVVIPRLGGEQALPQPPKVEQWQVLSIPPSASASVQSSASATPTSKTPVAQAPPPAIAPTWQNRPRWFALCYIMKL